MSGPKRWLDDPDSPDELREALGLSVEVRPPFDSDKGLARLEAAIIMAPVALDAGLPDAGLPNTGPPDAGLSSLGAPAQGAGAGGAQAAGVHAAWWGLATVGLAGLIFAAYSMLSGGEPSAHSNVRAPAVSNPDRTEPLPTNPTPARPERELEPTQVTTSGPRSQSSATEEIVHDVVPDGDAPPPSARARVQRSEQTLQPSEADRDGLLRREIAQLAEIRRQLAQDPGSALALARRGEREFRNGIFNEERGALAIFALYELERNTEARRDARRFVRRYPNGPFTERVRGLLSDR